MNAGGRLRRALVLVVTLVCASAAGDTAAQQLQPTPGAVAAAKELLELKGATAMFDPLVPGVIEAAKNTLLPTNPGLFKDLNEVADLLKQQYAGRRAEIVEEISRLYAQRFTEQELKEVIAFYRTPVGKKFVTVEPTVIDESLSRAEAWSNRLSDEVLERFRAEMKKRGHDL